MDLHVDIGYNHLMRQVMDDGQYFFIFKITSFIAVVMLSHEKQNLVEENLDFLVLAHSFCLLKAF